MRMSNLCDVKKLLIFAASLIRHLLTLLPDYSPAPVDENDVEVWEYEIVEGLSIQNGIFGKLYRYNL